MDPFRKFGHGDIRISAFVRVRNLLSLKSERSSERERRRERVGDLEELTIEMQEHLTLLLQPLCSANYVLPDDAVAIAAECAGVADARPWFDR
jgi:hypothetical protein